MCANVEENNTQWGQKQYNTPVRSPFLSGCQYIFLSSIEWGLLFSSTENKLSRKSGSELLFICELQVAAPFRSPPTTRPLVLLSDPVHFFHHMFQHFPFCLLCCFCPSGVPFFFVSRYCDALPSIVPGTDTL